jgi:uncharacterized iron-regulated membrane protein
MSRPRAASLRARQIALLVHRYVGLTMAVFLLVAGLTGSLLVFNEELDSACAPELFRVSPGARLLAPFELRERLQAQLEPGVNLYDIDLAPEQDKASTFWIQSNEGEWRQYFADPYTARLLGSREWGNLSEGWKNLMPFIYRLHYSLALDDVGTLLFGIVALLWTLDCFVGAYLTFPPSTNGRREPGRRGWLQRWLPSWLLRTNQLFSLVFSWHRASGLWVWAMLLVFAWSAVGLNLRSAYLPIMQNLAGLQPTAHDQLLELEPPFPVPGIDLRDALAIGRRLMSAEAQTRGFTVQREEALAFYQDHGVFNYSVRSTLDIAAAHGGTEVYFDDQGRLIGFEAPSGVNAANTFEHWLFGLHFAAVFGLWYRIFVCLMGLAVATLSVTGVWIWWRKRDKRAPQS